MMKNKDKFDKKNKENDELEKGDFLIANAFVIVLVAGLIIAGIAFSTMS